ncbi:hypothetical protein JCM3770_005517, partial [Rhodotorula araucariae]
MAAPNEVTALVRAFYASSRARLNPADLRSIGSICSALEAHNYKRALLLADQLLKKSPADPSALALKAVALSISSRPLSSSARFDILKVVDTAKTANGGAALADADVLMLFNHVLRAATGDDALELLAKAIEQNPNNEELSMEAFLQYVRANDCQSAQQISMRMAKQFKDERFFWWSILSTILLVRNLAHPQGTLLLSLAERQLSTRYAHLAASTENTPAGDERNKGYNSADEFHLVTRFLELRAQYAAACPSSSVAPSSSVPTLVLPSLRNTADGPVSPDDALLAHFASPEADKWCATNLGLELWRREAELDYGTAGNGAWAREVERLRGALEKGDTNWHTMLYLIRASVALASATSSSAPTADGLAHVTRAKDLFHQLATEGPRAKVERGYLLALLELAREGQVRGWPESEKLGLLVQEYFERFGGKACCFDDLYPYLAVLGEEDAETLRAALDAAARKHAQTVAAATKVINAHKVLRYLAPPPSVGDEQAHVDEFMRRYFDALPLGKDLPPTELQPADDFVLLAAQALVSAFHLSHDRSHLERALVVAEHALQRSKYKYQLRILAINLLRLLGASSAALAHYRVFGVKNIQHDTLSHLVLARGVTFAIEQGGNRAEAGVWEEMLNTEAWYAGGQREAREMVVKAFSYGAFGKVEDFTAFRQRLDGSLQGGLVALEALRMSVVRGQIDADEVAAGVEEVAKLVAATPDAYSDNRDFKTLPNYQRKGDAPIWTQTELAVRQDAVWLQALAGAYSRFLSPSTDVFAGNLPPSLTRSEAALVSFSQRAQAALVASLEDAPEREQAAVAFFKEQGELLLAAIDDQKTLPWELLQIAQVALE